MRICSILCASLLGLVIGTTVASAQALGTPSDLARVELERSRACVGIFRDVEALNDLMEPLGVRSRRLGMIAQAIAVEDASVVDSLDTADPLEERVREWFRSDAALAQRYLSQQSASIAAERAAGRETIKVAVSRAMEGVQSEANAVVAEHQPLINRASRCDGAIFVRSAVLEACGEGSGPVCDAAALPASEAQGFRFVDDASSIWEIEQTRPWSAPTPLTRGPNGQLDGARTVGFSRVGNLIVTAAFTPLFRPRRDTPPEIAAMYEATNDTLGLSFEHPDLLFTPALGIRASLPEAFGEEDGYILHFGPPEEAEVVWTADADTGESLQSTVPLTPGQVRRLTAGDPLTLTAISNEEDGPPTAGYAVVVGTVNQAPAAQALLGYMASRLSNDVTALVPPGGGS